MKPIIQVKSSPGLYHVLAVLTVGVWGTTFISTKVLIENGMHPQDIFFLRFLIAYLGIWLISPKRIFAKSLRDEVLLLLSGLTGGTLYFLTENTALGLTQTTNVSFIICATPLLTTLLAQMSSQREKVGSSLVIGSLIGCRTAYL
jgi:drug/metabolite transporter (DMT)-like permease